MRHLVTLSIWPHCHDIPSTVMSNWPHEGTKGQDSNGLTEVTNIVNNDTIPINREQEMFQSDWDAHTFHGKKEVSFEDCRCPEGNQVDSDDRPIFSECKGGGLFAILRETNINNGLLQIDSNRLKLTIDKTNHLIILYCPSCKGLPLDSLAITPQEIKLIRNDTLDSGYVAILLAFVCYYLFRLGQDQDSPFDRNGWDYRVCEWLFSVNALG